MLFMLYAYNAMLYSNHSSYNRRFIEQFLLKNLILNFVKIDYIFFNIIKLRQKRLLVAKS